MIDLERIPPQSCDAEQAVLGAVLVDRDMLEIATDFVGPAHFYEPRHEMLFAAMTALFEQRRPIDKISLCEYLRSRGQLDKIGGPGYLTQLMETVPTASSVEFYAQTVRDKAVLRGLIRAGARVVELGYDGELDVDDALSQAEQTLARVTLTERTPEADTRSFSDIGAAFITSWESATDDRVRLPWETLERETGGAYPGEMWIWAAAGGSGKSAVVGQIAEFTARKGGRVLLWAIEMGGARTFHRTIALYADGLTSRLQRSRDMRPDQIDRMFGTAADVMALTIDVMEQPRNALSDLRRVLRRAERSGQMPACVIVDHIGLIRDVDQGNRKNDALDRVYRGLVGLAKEFRVVMHVVQHVNREGMKGEPKLQDIRDGGNPEGHADCIIFPYRADTIAQPESGQFLLLKNRDGDPGRIDMRFIGRRHMWLDVVAGQTAERALGAA